MTKDKYKHAMERLSDMAEGKEIEWNGCGLWTRDPEPWLQTVEHLNSPQLIRTKPTPSKVPFGPEDIKAGMWFKLRSWAPGCRRLVIAVYNHGIHLGDDINTTITWDALLKDYSYSFDAITWHPCEKPSPPPPKREPRRVFVNFNKDGIPENVYREKINAQGCQDPDWCSESAVEFVEVIKQ